MNDDIARYIAAETGKTYRSGWTTVDQPLIDGFADLTRDWNPMHVDPVQAAASPLGATIAHGFLILALLAPLRREAARPEFPRLRSGLNYGLERVRFVSPVRSGSKLRGAFTVATIAEREPGRYLEELEVTIEIEGESRPALAARWLTLYLI